MSQKMKCSERFLDETETSFHFRAASIEKRLKELNFFPFQKNFESKLIIVSICW